VNGEFPGEELKPLELERCNDAPPTHKADQSFPIEWRRKIFGGWNELAVAESLIDSVDGIGG
jgi:hypothetical protein